MEINYDQEADAMYIRLRKGKFAKNKKIDDFTIVDLDKKGKVLGIELLETKKWMRPKTISKIKVKTAAVSAP